MAAGKGFSGQGGTVFKGTADTGTAATELFEVVKWTLDMTAAVHKYNSNRTGGHKRAVAGVRDTKGTIEIKVDSDVGPTLRAGEAVSLRLRDSGNSSNYFHIQHAVIAGNPVECDIDDGNIVSMTYNFEASDVDGAGIWAAATT
jgi:hypothetical protein